MSTPHRLLTEEFVAIYQRGHHKPAQMPCKLAHWTGGGQYDDPAPPLPISLNATAALHQLTHGEFAMPTKYDYDDHIKAVAGTYPIGPTLDQQRREHLETVVLRLFIRGGVIPGSAFLMGWLLWLVARQAWEALS